ncbi:MAG: hypothetical protein KGQ61_02265 [Planctomycetes bacterium]|nr:hypothetical protein [Planctomycetota bacterium]
MFAAALVAGAAVALGVNRLLELHLERQRPQVEREAIFVALRSLPGGSAVTVWDVALKPWPRAMIPTTAIRSIESYDGLTARQPLREGLPLLASQLSFDPEAAKRTPAATTTVTGNHGSGGGDLWLPGETPAGAEPVARVPQAPAPVAPAATIPEPTLPEPVPVIARQVPSREEPAAVPARPGAEARQPTAVISTDSDFAPVAVSADVDPPVAAEVPTAGPAAPAISVATVPTTADGGEERAARPTSSAPLTPLLPANWSPSPARTIVVPHRRALRGGGDTAAAVAAAVGAADRARIVTDLASPTAGTTAENRVVDTPVVAEPAVVDPPVTSIAEPITHPVLDPVVDDPASAPAAVVTRESPAAPLKRVVARLKPAAPLSPAPVTASDATPPTKKVVVGQLKPSDPPATTADATPPTRKVVVAQLKPSTPRPTAAGTAPEEAAALPRPLPPTTTRSRSPSAARPKPAASHGFRLPSIFDWGR